MAELVLAEFARLSGEQTRLEAEVAAIVEELTSGPNAPGVSGPLVDAEGFPRADIDVYRVRHQRHRFACLQTDHRAVMAQLEALLPQVFEARRVQQQAKTTSVEATPPPTVPPSAPPVAVSEPAVVREIDAADRAKQPFAVVDNVQPDSPAEAADLRAGDQVLAFGTADASNHRRLEAIKEIVQRNVGSTIRVLVRRQPLAKTGAASEANWEVEELLLIPQSWRGPGVLGCLLLPLDQP